MLTTETGETTETEGIACAAGGETETTPVCTDGVVVAVVVVVGVTVVTVGVIIGVCQSELPFEPLCALAFFIPIDAIISHKIKISFFIF